VLRPHEIPFASLPRPRSGVVVSARCLASRTPSRGTASRHLAGGPGRRRHGPGPFWPNCLS